jgi:hypothetical protein
VQALDKHRKRHRGYTRPDRVRELPVLPHVARPGVALLKRCPKSIALSSKPADGTASFRTRVTLTASRHSNVPERDGGDGTALSFDEPPGIKTRFAVLQVDERKVPDAHFRPLDMPFSTCPQ